MGDYVHSQQARFDKSLVSCGVMEVHHLPDKTPSHTCFSILNALYHKANPRPAAFVLFSDVDSAPISRGQQLARHINDTFQKSVLFVSRSRINPKTGNYIYVWLWTLDHDELRKYYQDELANRIDAET